MPIFIDNLNNVSAAFDAQGNQILFLPGDQCGLSKTIDVRLLKCDGVQKLVKRWGLKKASLLSDLKRVVREELCNAQEDQYVDRFRSIVNYCSTCTDDELIEIVKVFREADSLLAFNPATAKCGRRSAMSCYYPTDDLMFYFEGTTDVWFVDIKKYQEIVGNDGARGFHRLKAAMEMRQRPKHWLELSRDQISELYGKSRAWHSSYRQQSEKWTDLYIKGSRNWFRKFQEEANSEIQLRMSVIFWRYCCEIVRVVISGHEHIEDKLKGVHHYYYDHHWQEETYETYLHNLLKNTIWLFDNSGKMRQHADLVVEKMNGLYDVKSKEAQQLLELLGIRHDKKLMALNLLSDEDRQDLALAKDIKELGLGNLSDAKMLLERIPAEVRYKICTGVLSAEKILQAVVHLEQDQKVADNYVVLSQKGGDEEASGEVGHARGADVVMTLADNRMSGLSAEERHVALVEAKKMVVHQLQQEGFEFTKGICEDNCGTINGVMKDGVEYPLVVHSYIDKSRPFQLTTEDWCQLLKPNAKLLVITSDGICSVPFQDLVCNREKIEVSFSTKGNLEAKSRLEELAHVMRWFKGFHFDFGSLIPMEVGTAKMFDLPENQLSEEDKVAQMKPDNEQEVL